MRIMQGPVLCVTPASLRTLPGLLSPLAVMHVRRVRAPQRLSAQAPGVKRWLILLLDDYIITFLGEVDSEYITPKTFHLIAPIHQITRLGVGLSPEVEFSAPLNFLLTQEEPKPQASSVECWPSRPHRAPPSTARKARHMHPHTAHRPAQHTSHHTCVCSTACLLWRTRPQHGVRHGQCDRRAIAILGSRRRVASWAAWQPHPL